MSVAEQPTQTEQIERSPEAQLAGSSLLGACYLLATLGLIFSGLPTLWIQLFDSADKTKEVINPFLSGSLLLFVSVLAMLGLGYLGFVLDKKFSQKGLRAGSFIDALTIFFIAWVAVRVGGTLEAEFSEAVGLVIVLAVVAAMGFVAFKLYLTPGFRGFLIGLEEQGWFTLAGFKPNQGHKVRRATILGILTIGICGIYVIVMHKSLGSGSDNNWMWWIPFTDFTISEGVVGAQTITLMYKIHLLMPLILSAALLWFAWRIVNWPAFADFLIATEAEINKVSWTTRKRLVTDTIVVLVTVFFLTAFLFFVDIFWITVLKNRFISVLYVDVRGEQLKQSEKTLW